MIQHYSLRGLAGVVLIFLLCSTALGVEDACRWERPDPLPARAQVPAVESGDREVYTGTIRVFVTEIQGRWEDEDGETFENAFLSFALEEEISLGENDTLTWEVLWDGHDYYDAEGYNYGDLQENNVEVIAAVFNSASYTGYSDPDVSGSPFDVHEVDATAGAKSGRTGYNLTATGFTHSVFIQDGATTW